MVKIPRRKVLQLLVSIATLSCLSMQAMAIEDGRLPFIKVSVDYKRRNTNELLDAAGATVYLYKGDRQFGKKTTDAGGQAMWDNLPLAPDYRVLVEFNGQSQRFTGGGGNIPIRQGSKKRIPVFFWVP